MLTPRVRLRILAVLSVALFFVPIVAPFVQVITWVEAVRLGRAGRADRLSVALAAFGAGAGFLLFLAAEYLWVV